MATERAFITGLDGMVGPLLARDLLMKGFAVFGTTRPQVYPLVLNSLPEKADIQTYLCDLTNPQAVKTLVDEIKPQLLFHLAGFSRPRTSWDDQTYPVNTAIGFNIINTLVSGGHETRLIFVSTATVYASQEAGVVIDEASPLQPRDPYAGSKLAIEELLKIYSRRFPDFDYVITRPTNHTGFGRSDDFVECFVADQVIGIERGENDGITVANKLGGIDLLDVEDVVSAYALIAEGGVRGEVYNVASGRENNIEELARIMLTLSAVDSDPNIFIRSSGNEQQTGATFSNAKMRTLGWNPQVSLEETLKMVLDWRRKVFRNGGEMVD